MHDAPICMRHKTISFGESELRCMIHELLFLTFSCAEEFFSACKVLCGTVKIEITTWVASVDIDLKSFIVSLTVVKVYDLYDR